MNWKIGEIIKRTGLTARTLHFYEEIGLIGPITRTRSGHRVYSSADLILLQQILCFRSMGVSLKDMKAMLGDSKELKKRLKNQLKRFSIQRKELKKLEDKILELLEALSDDQINSNDLDTILFKTMEGMNMYQKYFSEEAIEKIHSVTGSNNDDKNSNDVWEKWLVDIKKELNSGTSADSDKVQSLMKQFSDMIIDVTNGDEEQIKAFYDLLHNEPKARLDHGIDDELFQFMAEAQGKH